MYKRYGLILLSFFFICSAWASEPVLTIYTYKSFISKWGPGPALKMQFEKQYNCKIRFISADDAVMLFNRVKMEGAKSKADIVLGLDNNLMSLATESQLFAPLNINTDNLTLPIHWQSQYFIPYDYSYFAFIYNKDNVKNPPKSLDELINKPNNLRIVYPDPRTSSVGLGLLLWVEKVYGDQSAQVWQKLAKKTLTVPSSWSESYGLLLNSEADLALSYTTSPAYHIASENDHRYVAADFSEGHMMQTEIAGLLKSAKEPELANKFLRYLLTPEAQYKIATMNWMLPVTKTSLPDAFDHLIKVSQPLDTPSKEVASHKEQWINTWQNAVSQ